MYIHNLNSQTCFTVKSALIISGESLSRLIRTIILEFPEAQAWHEDRWQLYWHWKGCSDSSVDETTGGNAAGDGHMPIEKSRTIQNQSGDIEQYRRVLRYVARQCHEAVSSGSRVTVIVSSLIELL